jgi:hypothetical protein
MASPSQATAAGAVDTVDPSGISLVGSDAIQFKAQNETQAKAFDAALNLAYDHRDNMGYPWFDFHTNTLELRPTDDAGRTAADAAVATLRSAGWTTRISSATASVAQLDQIADDVTRLTADGVPNADRIWMTEPDQMNNRVIVTVSELNSDLMAALASRFGTKLIAVRVRAGGPAALTACSGRDCDAPSFWGGAFWSAPNWNCTTGFAWNVGGGVDGMLTAAHCISSGGSASYPSYPNAGSVRSASEENWSDADGTRYYTGQSVYRGDVALIRYSSAYSSSSYIYSGAPHTSTHSGVYGMASRWSQVGDAACANGVTTGEWCGMVTGTGVNIWYLVNGFNVWARHVVDASALGNTCPTHGDSGGPVYRKRSDGTVYAVGIYSGSSPIVIGCDAFFTDIWDAYYGLPGTLK